MLHQVWKVMGKQFYKQTYPTYPTSTYSYKHSLLQTHTFHAQYHIRTGFLILLYRTASCTRSQLLLVYRHQGSYTHWNCSTHYFHSILSITFNIMSSFFLNSSFILVHYIILKLNVSSHPLVYEKIKKIFMPPG